MLISENVKSSTNISEDTTKRGRSDLDRDGDRRDDSRETTIERLIAGSTQTNIGLVAQWASEKYCPRRAALMNMERFLAMEEIDQSFVM